MSHSLHHQDKLFDGLAVSQIFDFFCLKDSTLYEQAKAGFRTFRFCEDIQSQSSKIAWPSNQ